MLYAVSVFFLLQSMSALGFIDLAIYGSWYGKHGTKITQTMNSLSLLAALFLFWSSTRTTGIARFNRVLPLTAASLLLISILWSHDPRTTFTQGIQYFFLVLGAVGLGEAWDSDAAMDLVALLCGLSAVASLVQFFIFPVPTEFPGIFAGKNQLGQVMAVGVLAALHATRVRRGRRFRYICLIALCTILGFMSKSGTAILTIVSFFGFDILGRLYLKGGNSRITSICLAIWFIPIAIIFFMNEDSILDFFGKDPTLTGRTMLWPLVVDQISEKPILGWGFYGFWSPLNPAASQVFEAARGPTGYVLIWANSHNTMLEFLLGIGFLGTSFFIFLWARNFVMAVKCMSGPAGQIGLSSVMLLIGILLVGTSEVVLLSAGQIWTSLFFMMGFFCERNLWLARGARKWKGRVPARR
jgi:O-antigen ligase